MQIISLHINIQGFICIVNIADYLVKHMIKIDNSISMNNTNTCWYKLHAITLQLQEYHYTNYK